MSAPIKLQQWRYFIAVAEALSFRLAAQHLFITQPSLSRQIQQLEAQLGLTLLERNRQGVRLTPAGQAVLAQARSLLQAAQALQNLQSLPGLQAIAQAQQRAAPQLVRLGLSSAVDASVLAGVSQAIEQQWPGCQVQLLRERSLNLIKRLRRSELALAIIGLPAATQGLELRLLTVDPLVACLASSHPLARQRRLQLADLQTTPLFWFHRALNPSFYDYCEHTFAQLNFQPQRLPEPAQHHVLLEQVASGQGWALVPRSMKALRRPGVVYRDVLGAEPLCIRLGLAWLPASAAAPHAQEPKPAALARYIEAHWPTAQQV